MVLHPLLKKYWELQWNPDFSNPRFQEPPLVSLWFAWLKLHNFTPDFSNPGFLETPDNSNQFWLSWDKLNEPVKISKLLGADVNYIHIFKQICTSGKAVFSHKQATNLSSVWKFAYSNAFSTLLSQYINKFCLLEMKSMLIIDQSFSNAKGQQVIKIISAKLRERYIPPGAIYRLHTTCVLLCSIFVYKYVLFVNKGQDLHWKGCSFVKP